MKFNYIAKTKDGDKETGVVVAFNISEAKKILLGKDLILFSLLPVKEKRRRITDPLFLFGVSFLDKILFIKHLSLMIKAGLPLRESIAIIQEQLKSKKFKRILDDVLLSIDNGHSLADSLAIHPKIFDAFYINMIRVGEESGTLEENFKHLAQQLEKNYDLKRKIIAAMLYPGIIFTAVIVLSSLLTFFILPQITPLFKVFRIELPLATRILIGFTDVIKNYGLFILIAVVFLFLISFLIYRIRAVKYLFHKIVLRLPIFGSMIKNINLVYFCKNLSTLLKSGVSLIGALDITETTLSNLLYQKELKEMKGEVKKGKPISGYLKKKEDLFPLTLSQMISVGEKTGSLEETLIYLGNFYNAEIDRTTKNLSTILEPVLLLIVGILVGFVAIAIISPIYEVTGGLHP